ncbi:MAG: uL22 family ribosomal protein [Candidatus Aenigmatarchaeota archaeon]
MKYAIKTKEKACASSTLPISLKNSVKVCRAINRKKFSDAKKFLEDLLNKKISLNGKYFTKTVKEILKLLNQLEKNAKNKNIDPNPLFLFISAHKGPTLRRARRRWRKFGTQLKICHIQAVLSEKDGFGKKVH